MQDWYFQNKVAPFDYLEVTLRPSGKKLYLFCDKIITKQVMNPHSYATGIKLAYPVSVAPYGKINSLEIHHDYPWSTRVGKGGSGDARYAGYTVKHHDVSSLVLYDEPRGGFDLDHAKPHPVYVLAEAPGDFYLPKFSNVAFNLAKATEFIGEGGKQITRFDVTQLQRAIKSFEQELKERSREAMDWHAKYIQAEEQVAQIKNELVALLKSKGDFKKSIIEFLLMIRREQLRIENAIKKLQGPRFTFNKWVALTIIMCGVTALLYLRPEIAQSLQVFLQQPGNQAMVAIIAIVIGAIAVLGGRQLKK